LMRCLYFVLPVEKESDDVSQKDIESFDRRSLSSSKLLIHHAYVLFSDGL
jgi:hypothetical protein